MNRKFLNEIINFGWVGILCFIIDFGLLYCITKFLDVNYLISSGISFSVSVIINYLLSKIYVFQANSKSNKAIEIGIFVILSLFGLLINQIIMWIGTEQFEYNYLFVKIWATGFVMIYNFISRKYLFAK